MNKHNMEPFHHHRPRHRQFIQFSTISCRCSITAQHNEENMTIDITTTTSWPLSYIITHIFIFIIILLLCCILCLPNNQPSPDASSLCDINQLISEESLFREPVAPKRPSAYPSYKDLPYLHHAPNLFCQLLLD
jgi:hypothetical protein